MLPIPKHLQDIFIPIGDKNCENQVNGVIRCSCGCESFHIKIFADTEEGCAEVCEYKDGFALVVKAVCMDCGKEYLIFDDSRNGWDGFVCQDGIPVPDEELKSWNCPKCDCDIHNIELCILSQGKQDFIDTSGIADGETEFSEDDWVEAFEWITIGLKCYNCSHREVDWVDYETM